MPGSTGGPVGTMTWPMSLRAGTPVPGPRLWPPQSPVPGPGRPEPALPDGGALRCPLHDRRLVAGPVRVAQEALVQLARFRPGQLGHEVDGPRALEVGEPVPAVVDQL